MTLEASLLLMHSEATLNATTPKSQFGARPVYVDAYVSQRMVWALRQYGLALIMSAAPKVWNSSKRKVDAWLFVQHYKIV